MVTARKAADKIRPQNLEAERSVLGSILLCNEARDKIPFLKATHFYNPAHAEIYAACIAILDGGGPVDAVTLAEELDAKGRLDDCGGVVYLLKVLENVPHAVNVKRYAEIVLEKYERRVVQTRAEKLLEDIHTDTKTNDLIASLDFSDLVGNDGNRFDMLSSSDFADAEYNLEYLIRDLIPAGQPGIICGPKKSLKTSIMVETAMTLASGGYVLGHERFQVARPTRVGIMSGESGEATLQETFRRIAAAKGRMPQSYENLHWCFDVPQLSSIEDVQAIRKMVLRLKLAILFIDPTYLSFATNGNEGSIFAMGALLRNMSDLGCSVVLVHHTAKSSGANQNEVPELDDMSWAGFAEYARWWILLSRRGKYDASRGGHHELWLNAGGSAGHSTLLGVDIDEGTSQTPGGRFWEVSIMTPEQARTATAEESEDDAERAAEQKAARRLQKNQEKVLKVLRGVGRSGETKTKIRDRSGVNKGLDSIIEGLLEDGTIEVCDVTKSHSKYSGFRLRSDNSDNSDKSKPSDLSGVVVGQPPLGGVRPTDHLPGEQNGHSDKTKQSDLSTATDAERDYI